MAATSGASGEGRVVPAADPFAAPSASHVASEGIEGRVNGAASSPLHFERFDADKFWTMSNPPDTPPELRNRVVSGDRVAATLLALIAATITAFGLVYGLNK